MSILVIAEHDNAQLKAATLNTVAAATKLGGEVHVLVAGHNAKTVADAAAQAAGVTKVLHADAAQLAEGLAENLAAQVLDVLARYHISNACLPDAVAIQIAHEADLLELHADTLALRALAVQGMPLPPDVVERYQTTLGLTPNLCWSEPQAAMVLGESHLKWPGRAGSLGRAYPGHRIGVLDEAGQPCTVGSVGTLAVHHSDVQGVPDPLLPLARATTPDVWTPLSLRARVDKDGYFWPEPAQTG